MERDAIVIYAENEPMPGVAHPGPHQNYRHPRVEVEMRTRGHLGGAFHSLLALYRQGRFSPGEIVTSVLGGLGELADLLRSSDQVALQDCKILVKLQHEQSA